MKGWTSDQTREYYETLPSEETIRGMLKAMDLEEDDFVNEEICLVRIFSKKSLDFQGGWGFMPVTEYGVACFKNSNRLAAERRNNANRQQVHIPETPSTYPRPPSVKRRISSSSESGLSDNPPTPDTDEDFRFQSEDFSSTWDEYREEKLNSSCKLLPQLEEGTYESD